jgi:proton-dependent oligopeptide transporter, POT family
MSNESALPAPNGVKAKPSIGDNVRNYFSEYNKLPKLPVFFWFTIIYNFVDIIAYTFVSNTYFPFFTKNVGFSGTVVGSWFFVIGFVITAFVLMGGMIVDRFGAKRIYIIKMTLAAITRILATFFQDYPFVALILHGASFCFVGMGSVVTYMLLKRFSNKQTSILVFSFQYFTMNMAFFVGGPLYDLVRNTGITLEVGLSTCMYVGAGLYVLAALIMLFFVNDKQTINENYKVIPYRPEIDEKQQKRFTAYFTGTFMERTFWLYVAVMVIAAMARFIFTIPHVTLPNVMYNVIGPDAAVGTVGAINPFLIFMGLMLLTPLLAKMKTPNALFIGTLISGGSLAFYLIPPNVIGGPVSSFLYEILGTGIPAVILGFYILIVFQMIFYSTGEIMWSPRLSEFGMRIAPRGKEGIYSSLVVIPLMITKFFLPLNGYLLDTYCPDTGVVPKLMGGMAFTDSPSMIFLVFLAILLVTPLAVFLFRGYIQKRIDEADERHRKAIEEEERLASQRETEDTIEGGA